MKLKKRQWKGSRPIFLLIIALLVNVVLSFSPGTIDTRDFLQLFQDVLTMGNQFIPDCLHYQCPSGSILTKFPPGHALLFYLFSFLFPVRLLGAFISMKALIFLFYLLTIASSWWFYRFMGGKKVDTLPMLAIIASLGSLILNTQGLGYTDVLGFPFFILSIGYLLKKKYGIAGCWLGVSCLIKWQPIIMLPVIVVWIIRNEIRRNHWSIVQFILGCFAPLGFLYLLDKALPGALLSSLNNALGHQATSALNIPWILRHLPWQFTQVGPDGLPHPWVALMQLSVFILAYILILCRIAFFPSKEAKDTLLMGLLMAMGAYYLFSFGVHENHFIVATVIGLLIYLRHPTQRRFMLLRGIDGINLLNMFIFYGVTGTPLVPEVVWGINITVILSAFISVIGISFFVSWLRFYRATEYL